MTYRWDLQPIPPQFDPQIALQYGRYVAKILALRGITTPEAALSFLSPSHYLPTSAWELPDMERAVDRILLAKAQGERVLIWGDFDCDGVTSTSLLLSALKPLGLDLHFTIPLRSEEGHGLNAARLHRILQQGTQLIVTVDCGVADRDEIAMAQAQGVDVIVTDHHLLPDPLPQVQAVIDPLRLPEDHPLRFLPGVGVAYKLAEAIYDRLGWPDVEQFLDLAVVGIVADVAVLQRECRYLVQTGLPILARTQREGLKQLIEHQIGNREVSAQDIGFRIAPKLNAIGRLDDASLAVDLLTTTDPEQAQALIELFLQKNDERKRLTEQVVTEASQQVENRDLVQDRAIVLASPTWNQGVVGIAASRLVETYGCPTVLIACNATRGEGYGSARSIPTVDLVDAMDEVAELLSGYGGHSMAAGLRVSLDRVDALQLALKEALALRVSSDVVARDVSIEIALDMHQISEIVPELDRVYEQISLLEPFGHGNPAPVIALLNLQPSRFNPDVSRNGQHLQFKIGPRRLWFWREGYQQRSLSEAKLLDIAFVMEGSTWADQPWQGKVKDVRIGGEWQLEPVPKRDLTVEDWRGRETPPKAGAIFTGEIPEPAEDLLLLRWPWLPQDLQRILQTVRPRRILLGTHASDISTVNRWIVEVVQSWHRGARDLDGLAPADMPRPLLQRVLSSPESTDEIGPAMARLLREVQAFHQWLDTAEPRAILHLCQRLMG